MYGLHVVISGHGVGRSVSSPQGGHGSRLGEFVEWYVLDICYVPFAQCSLPERRVI